MTNTEVITLQQNEAKKLYEKYISYQATPPAHALFLLKLAGCTITHYKSGKTVFQGTDIAPYISEFKNTETSSVVLQAGSDEVGTGDYFGPVVVCAAIVDRDNASIVEGLRISDSKVMKDERILEIGQELIRSSKHFVYTLPPEKYNEVHKTYNINAIKAIMHNACWLQLEKKYSLPSLKVVDQFAPENTYFRYLTSQPRIFRDLRFETKSEKKYPSVALASVIARYTFLQYWQNMESSYGMEFQKGASGLTDACIVKFVEKYSFEELRNVAKMHFANTNIVHK